MVTGYNVPLTETTVVGAGVVVTTTAGVLDPLKGVMNVPLPNVGVSVPCVVGASGVPAVALA